MLSGSGNKHVIISILTLIALVCGCIDPYTPVLKDYKPLLVVEGLISNENRSNVISLSYSKQKNDSVIQRISDATVYLSDDKGNIINLLNSGRGLYRTDSLSFVGSVGSAYQLHIELPDGRSYISDSCTMLPVPGIDTVYYAEDEQLSTDMTVMKKGVSVYLQSEPFPNDEYYLRWEYEDTWQFKVPEPVRYTYINSHNIPPVPPGEVKEICWKSGRPSEILVRKVNGNDPVGEVKEQIKFIAPDESDRLSVRYSILVRQYSISPKEYIFWNDLRKMEESAGDIFDPVPFEVLSNVKNVSNPSEKVLGYFQVSAVSKKRIFIDYGDIAIYALPDFHYHCVSYPMRPDPKEINTETWRPYTWDQFYVHILRVYYPLRFVRPVYYRLQDSLLYLVFASPYCSDCELSGTFVRPDFWTDK